MKKPPIKNNLTDYSTEEVSRKLKQLVSYANHMYYETGNDVEPDVIGDIARLSAELVCRFLKSKI